MKNKNDKQHDAEDKSSKNSPEVLESATLSNNENHDAIESESIESEPVKEPEESTATLSPSHHDIRQDSGHKKVPLSKLAIFALLLVLLLGVAGGWGFYYLYQIVNTEQHSITQLNDSHSADFAVVKRQLAQQATNQEKQATTLRQEVEQSQLENQQLLASLQEKMVELAGRRPNDWLLAEANFLVKLAGRKLWQEKDINTASTLLSTADMRIAEMNEPSLIHIRKALASDIASLQALPRDNSESLALKLDGLISQVDNLKLNMVELPEEAQEQSSQALSESASDWQDNLKRMWHSFSDGFITVRRRNGSVEPLMSPKQQWYLEENLKSKLMQTQLAVYRQQQQAYEHAIELSSRWIMQFYDRQDSTTEFMLSELDALRNQKVSFEYPQKLSSSNLIIDELLMRNVGYEKQASR